MNWMTKRPVALAGLCLFALPACTPGGGEGQGDDVGEEGSESAGEDQGEDDAELVECEAPHDPGPAPLRRLTGSQYNNTVRDLFVGAEIPEQTILVDPLVAGYENNAEAQTPSALLIEQYQRAAVAVTAAAMVTPEAWLPCTDDGGADPQGCGHQLIADFGRRAFRRPLDAALQATYEGFFDEQLAAEDFRIAAQLTLQAMLQSPQFIYFLESGASSGSDVLTLDDYSMATRLSYFLWDTMPDAELFAAAEAGELTSEAGLLAQTERLLADPRARAATVNFFRQWFDLDSIEQIDLDVATYPSFTPELNASMREELERFVEWVVFDSEGSYAQLLTSDQTWVNPELAAIYGVAAPGEDWALVDLDASQRAGVLTTTGFLSSRAHAVNPSPVQRGVFVLEHLLCQPPPSPPGNVSTEVPEDEPSEPKTNRERYQAHTTDPLCQGCHQNIDGIGFGFEHYDSLGAWRDLDNGFPVDASGELFGSDVDGPFDGAVELAERLAVSEVAQRCAVNNYLRWALGRSPTLDDLCFEADIDAAFIESEGDLQTLVLEIVLSEAFRTRRSEG
ncbi:DUF1592 domain-containing protein [Pseudenhygromyxa sp. WMMC2535]|uniref:DUF1592 domain-containing protein n=1 Tax=Pseudenhygromyxa sp. WMMC2535 TaxID=2712867 RepID=UPI0020D1A881|nr:DUF1592 domain-containing protein [Pseudenhygromyxa sp. WMMC2535]